MLDPDYLLALSEGAEEIAATLHEDILRRIVERIMIRLQRGDDYILTPLDKWQLEVLQESGALREDLEKVIAQRTPHGLEAIREAFREAGVETLQYDHRIYEAAGLSPAPLMHSPYLIRLLERSYEATAGTWENYTRTTADAAQQLFIRECDKAYNLVTTGAISYAQACTEAVETIAEEGVVVEYPSGWRDTIETATLRAVRTGVGQSCAEISLRRMEEMGWDIALVSAHLGARPGDGGENAGNHAWWQGKFYSLSGKDPRFPPIAVCGIGTGEGLGGWNCRHSVGPGDGENNPFEHYDSEENRKAYDLSQRQRAMERRIRKTKREAIALHEAVKNADDATRPELERAYQKKAALLQKQNRAYNEFCEKHELKPVQERLKVAGWDRKQASAATAAARKTSLPTLKNAAGRSIMPVKHTRLNAAPNSITEYTTAKGGKDRNFYDADGRQVLQISNHDHGHKAESKLGEHGEHAHDYFWNREGKARRGSARELTDEERRDNSDFL